MSVFYFAEKHRFGLFHGDIKPDNFFMDGGFVSSDAGTLLILEENDNNKQYPVRFCTPAFCSK